MKKIITALREWIDTYHYDSISGMLLEYGIVIFSAIVVILLVRMVLSAMWTLCYVKDVTSFLSNLCKYNLRCQM